MAPFQRPPGFPYKFLGVNTRSEPDQIPPGKYAAAVNIRQTADEALTTRPGYVPLFHGNNFAITDIKSYATLGTDNNPRFLAADSIGHIWLDNNTNVTILSGGNSIGVSMVPFRPSASAQSWMYIAGNNSYQKVSAPDSGNNTAVYIVGLMEPQYTLEAGINTLDYTEFDAVAASWVAGGTASGPFDDQIANDPITTAIFPDPVTSGRYSITVTYIAYYQEGLILKFSGGQKAVCQEVLPSVGSGFTISAIRYDAGSSGACTIVPTSTTGDVASELAALSRGALLSLGGSETVYVLSVTTGPNGAISFRVSTSGTWTAGASIAGVNAIVVDGVTSGIAGDTITICPDVGATFGAGTGTLSQALSANPFSTPLGGSGPIPQSDDYINFFIQVQNPAIVTQISLIFNVGAVVDYVSQVYTYSLNAAALSEASFGSLTDIRFPISSLTNSGGGATLASCNGVQLLVTTSGTTASAILIGSLWVGGGGNPDVGADGAPYKWLVIGRSSITGAQSNSSAIMRYGLNPRRQAVTVKTSAVGNGGDPQLDTWDIYRYGGSITSYLYVGTTAYGADFTDNYFDTSLQVNRPLPTQNFEPWPSIDVPFSVTAGGGTTITVTGTTIVVSGPSVWPATILRWLPGTLIQLSNLQAYTLRLRPVELSSTSYLFEVQESAGAFSSTFFTVTEPNVARQPAPYMWGPDQYGTMFAVGDQLRPGIIYFAQAYAPDEAPNNFSIELCPPSEPLLGGCIINGISIVASTTQWWALYPAFSGSVPYTAIPQGVGKPLATPRGIASDKSTMYFWGKDGIYMSSGGGAATSLTDADLYNLFPHEGVQGQDVTRQGGSFYAPDYRLGGKFRLSIQGNYLKATYVPHFDNTLRQTLVCDLRTGGWSKDNYNAGETQMSCQYYVEQQEGTVLAGGSSLYPLVLFGDILGNIYQQQDLTNDNGTNIVPAVQTFEYDGGDLRAAFQWGDLFLDCLPQTTGGILATPLSGGIPIGSPTTIGTSVNRVAAPISVDAGGTLLRFLGLMVSWTDNFGVQSVATVIYTWQPSFVPKPETTADRAEDWMDLGGANYVRALVLMADTFNTIKSIGVESGDTLTSQVFNILHNGQQEIAYPLTPEVAHTLRLVPQDMIPWRIFSVAWTMDKWPELTTEVSPWSDLGDNRAKYFRRLVIPMDTNGAPVNVTVTGDGVTVTFTGITTPAGKKTAVALAFVTPFIAHEVQVAPSAAARMWYTEMEWGFEIWPELIQENSPWMNCGQVGAKYLLSFVLPMDTGNNNVSYTLYGSDANTTPLTLGPFVTPANQKTEVPMAVILPFVYHECQLKPSAKVRSWWSEIKWRFDAYPEETLEYTPILEIGGVEAMYVRGVRITGDSTNLPVSFQVLFDGVQNGQVIGPLTFNGKETLAWAFTPPFVAHNIQLVPNAAVRMFVEECKYDFDTYPELIPEYTSILEIGGVDAMYVRGVRITADSANSPVSFHVLFDGMQSGPTIGPLTFNGKQTIAWAFTPPFIAHNIQLVPNAPVRIFIGECKYDYDTYPELIPEYTSILEYNTPDASYVQGIKITADSNNQPVSFHILYDGGQSGPTIGPATFNGKSTQAFTFTPFIAHNWQLVPNAPVRIFVPECKWVFEPTPENVLQWGPTQWTAHGTSGFHHIGRFEVAYAASQSVTITVASFDGTSPQVITLPPTGSVLQRKLITPTFNKGTLYQYSAISAGRFQISLNDWTVWIGAWGRPGAYLAYRNLGSQMGDKAKI